MLPISVADAVLTYRQTPQRKPHHFTAVKGDGPESYRVKPYTTDDIQGTILIAEGTHFSTDDMQKALADDLGSKTSSTALDSEPSQDEEPDRWILKALHVLQKRGVTSKFNVGEFVTFVKSYEEGRKEGHAPAMIAYPGLHKEPEKKNKKDGFWLTFPTQTNKKGDSESRTYGGLM